MQGISSYYYYTHRLAVFVLYSNRFEAANATDYIQGCYFLFPPLDIVFPLFHQLVFVLQVNLFLFFGLLLRLGSLFFGFFLLQY